MKHDLDHGISAPFSNLTKLDEKVRFSRIIAFVKGDFAEVAIHSLAWVTARSAVRENSTDRSRGSWPE
jgi:hypothetical protein